MTTLSLSAPSLTIPPITMATVSPRIEPFRFSMRSCKGGTATGSPMRKPTRTHQDGIWVRCSGSRARPICPGRLPRLHRVRHLCPSARTSLSGNLRLGTQEGSRRRGQGARLIPSRCEPAYPQSDARRLEPEERRNHERPAGHDEAEVSLQSFTRQLSETMGEELPATHRGRKISCFFREHPAEDWPPEGLAAADSHAGDGANVRNELQRSPG